MGKKNPANILTSENLAKLPKEITRDLLKVTAKLDQKDCFTIFEKLYMINMEVAPALIILVENYHFEEHANILGRND